MSAFLGKAWAVVLVVAAAVAGVTALVGAPPASADCTITLQFRGVSYDAAVLPHAPFEPGRRLGEAVVPACNDTNRQPPPPDGRAGVRRIRGVPARIALVRADEPQLPYLATGFVLDLASHPLHDELADPVAPRGCGRPRLILGMLRGARYGGLFLIGGEEVAVGPHTKVRTPRRVAGTPRFVAGDRLAIRGSRCRDDVIRADRIAVRPADG